MTEKELKGYRAFIQIGIPDDMDKTKLIRDYYGVPSAVISALTISLCEVAMAVEIPLKDLIDRTNEVFTTMYDSDTIIGDES